MKRLSVFCLLMVTLLGLQFLMNCSNPLESLEDFDPNPEINFTIETILVIDTLMIIDSMANFDTTYTYDTTYIFDTTFFDDSVSVETLIIIDTIINTDSFIIVDSFFSNDTTVIFDTSYIVDTIFIGDSIIGFDTIIIIDTIILDSSYIDTVILTDTVVIDSSTVDTIIFTDTIDITDTVIIIDTVIIEKPDTSGSQYICNQLSPYQKEIVWMFSNDEGLYNLEFLANSENSKPDRILTLYINGHKYIWDLSNTSEFILDKNLAANTIIKIIVNKPSSFGHAIDLCLTMTPQ